MLFIDIHQLIIYSYSPHIEFVRTRPTLREGYHAVFRVGGEGLEPPEAEAT